MVEIYRQRVAALHETLQDETTKLRAAEVFRSLVDQVTLVPENGALSIVWRGDLAAMLSFAAAEKKSGSSPDADLPEAVLSQLSLVAGTGFEPVTFRL